MLQSLLRTIPWSAKREYFVTAAKSHEGRVAAKLLVFNYLQAAISFAVSMWLARYLGAEAYGVIGYGISLAAISGTLVDFGGERTLVRDLTHSEDANATMTASMTLRAVLAVVVGVIGSFWIASSDFAQDNRLPLIFCSLSGLLFGLSPRGWYDYRYEMNAHAWVLLVEKVLYSISTVCLVLLFPLKVSVLIVACCLLGSRLGSFAAQWWQVRRSYTPVVENLGANLRWLVTENTFVAAAMLGNMMAPHVNGLLLGYQKGEASMAHYFLAFQVMAAVQILQQVAVRMLVPRIAEVTRPGTSVALMRGRFVRFAMYSLTITLVLVVPMILLAGWMIGSFLPNNFQASVLPLRLLLFSCIAHSMGLVFNHFLICLRKNSHYFTTSIGKGLLAIALGWLLIPQYGAVGVALTILLCATLTMMVQCGLAWNAISQREPSVEAN